MPTLALLRIASRPLSRACETTPQVDLGEVIPRIDYSPQPRAIGNLHKASVDCGEDLNRGGRLRLALAEAGGNRA